MFFTHILNAENTEFVDTNTAMKYSTDSMTSQQQNRKRNSISSNHGCREAAAGTSAPTLAAAAQPAKSTSAPMKAGRVSYTHAFLFKWIRKLQNIFIWESE